MTYANLMVNMELGRLNTGLLQVAGDLAELLHASVTGIAVCQPTQMNYDATYIDPDFYEQFRIQTETNIKEAEAEFRNALKLRAQTLDWRSMVMAGSLADYVAIEARGADLVITGVGAHNASETLRNVDTGSLVMQAGRPVFLVPIAVEKLSLDRVLVAWKDTRETRRAVWDALPLLKLAAHVTVIELFTQEDPVIPHRGMDDILHWLKLHGIVAESSALHASGDDANQLDAAAKEHNINLIVAGAYGHSRLREWAFGGVTRELLIQGERCSLISH